ncbi:D-alanyl-D-alanine carboxypeptidase family protein [Paenibacillus agricola]|uniref:serine-type D-Ala-D-Ala carboxypeptidase n=1 Tax=Paenibacillus agricola TaxID=2716264 RepID=A0ABX0J3S2_9BACL|nr:D-alanyl-D-alanine carboxypeptidase family protein [Paenibacillus agricola]NHN28766.1 D-alanyl-D-alanine carboxypeptidase [Paenibacillus agricola]
MNRKVNFLLILALLSIIWTPLVPLHAAPALSTSAEAVALIDVRSGRILYSKQGDKPLRIASLTKIMTAIVAIEHGRLSDSAKVSKNAFAKEGSSIYLKLDEEMSLHHLLYGMMLRSGNDAATAIAEHVGGTVEGFAYLMNEKARMIGMDHSLFKNPSGLDEEGHLSTANDMAKLAAYALHHPQFQEIVKTKLKKAPNPNDPWDYTWLNKNKMLNLYEGADGVKTGYTKLSKRCLVSSATRGGQQLAVVTLNDANDWADHAKLLDYGFNNYPLTPLIHKWDAVEGTEWVAGADFSYPTQEAEKGQYTFKVEVNDNQSTSFRLGEVGRLAYMLEGKSIGQVPLLAKDSPRLKLNERNVFSSQGIFQGTLSANATHVEKWLFIVQFLVRMVFTGHAVH